MASDAQSHSREKAWLLRALVVLQSPRGVFAALRDDSEADVDARQEPVLALVWLAGMAAVLASPAMNDLMDDPARDAVVVAIIIFFAGGIYGLVAYFLLGGVLHVCTRAFGSQGTFRRARHLLAFAVAPLALALITFWPIRIAVYGEDLFRTGGDDYGRGDAIFGGIYFGIAGWCLWLLLVGVRSVHGWSWGRSVIAVALAAAFPALIVVAASL